MPASQCRRSADRSVDGISDFNALHSRKYFALNLRFPETAARW
jgi:hypothetical protein